MKEEIKPEKVKRFIEALDDLRVKCIALLLATSGLRKGEVWNLRKGDIDRKRRCIIPNCHSGKTKHSGISFFNEEAEACLKKYEKTLSIKKGEGERLFVIGHEQFLRAWRNARFSAIFCSVRGLTTSWSLPLVSEGFVSTGALD